MHKRSLWRKKHCKTSCYLLNRRISQVILSSYFYQYNLSQSQRSVGLCACIFGPYPGPFFRLLNSGITRRPPERVAHHHNVVLDAIDAGLLVLGLGGLDDLVEGGKEAESAEPPHEALGGIDVLAVKIKAHLGGHAIVPDGINILD